MFAALLCAETQTLAGYLFRIPLGTPRSVERRTTPQKQHPVRDASLTGCRGRNIRTFSTERHIPDGMSTTMINYLFFVPKRSLMNKSHCRKTSFSFINDFCTFVTVFCAFVKNFQIFVGKCFSITKTILYLQPVVFLHQKSNQWYSPVYMTQRLKALYSIAQGNALRKNAPAKLKP